MHCSAIQQYFTGYYQELGFQLLPSGSMLHSSIPMSFVMSAGLVQVETSLARSANRSENKFLLVQNCFRHFDLPRIGTDNTHLSLFEMPAVFEFRAANPQGTLWHLWHFVTEILGINAQQIWVSYFGGDQISGHDLGQDEETYNAWRNIGIPEHRLVGLTGDHNYWVQGGGFDNEGSQWRKCGPTTELFYDLGEEQSCGAQCRPGCSCGRFVEFSNTLFVSHQLHSQTNELRKMADPFTEAVIGTQRIAMILQNAPSVFDIEENKPIIQAIQVYSAPDDLPEHLIIESERVIADYTNALAALVTEGAPPPGKNGRERIIKLLIRGIITRKILLGIDINRFPLLAEYAVKKQGILPDSLDKIENYFMREAQCFQKTVQRGLKKMETLLEQNQRKTLSGYQIVFLEKRCGLPSLLIAASLRKKHLQFLQEDYKDVVTEWKKSLLTTSR